MESKERQISNIQEEVLRAAARAWFHAKYESCGDYQNTDVELVEIVDLDEHYVRYAHHLPGHWTPSTEGDERKETTLTADRPRHIALCRLRDYMLYALEASKSGYARWNCADDYKGEYTAKAEFANIIDQIAKEETAKRRYH